MSEQVKVSCTNWCRNVWQTQGISRTLPVRDKIVHGMSLLSGKNGLGSNNKETASGNAGMRGCPCYRSES
jgi:hypothetical protein